LTILGQRSKRGKQFFFFAAPLSPGAIASATAPPNSHRRRPRGKVAAGSTLTNADNTMRNGARDGAKKDAARG